MPPLPPVLSRGLMLPALSTRSLRSPALTRTFLLPPSPATAHTLIASLLVILLHLLWWYLTPAPASTVTSMPTASPLLVSSCPAAAPSVASMSVSPPV